MKLKKISIFLFLFAAYTQFHSQMWVPATPFPGAMGNISLGGIDETRVNCLHIYNGDLIVGGNFTSIGGIVSHGIAKWNGNVWSSIGAGDYLNHKVTDLCSFQNKLYVAAGILECWNGSQWTNFTLGNNETVSARELHVFNNELYIITQNSTLLKYNGTNFIEIQSTNNFSGYPYCMEDYNGELFIGTSFGLYKYSNSTWVNCTGIVTNNPIIVDIEEYNGHLYAIGFFATIGGINVQNLAKYNGSNWINVNLPGGFWPQVEHGGLVADVAQNSLNVLENNLYVSAYFGTTQSSNFDPNPLYKFDGTAWSDLGLNCVSTEDLGFGNTSIIYQGELFAGGSFTTIASSPWENINMDISDNCFIKIDQNLTALTWDSRINKHIHPNPTPSEITITSDQFTNERYSIYDQMGRTVGSGTLTGTNTTLSLSTLSKGIYILKVEGAYESAIVVKE
ncbi:MAG: hypothetical protein RL737_1764 [Bacteroidota bacterium]|jgi:hypothetical protein